MSLERTDYILLGIVAALLAVDHFISGLPFLSWVFVGVVIYSLNYKKYKDTTLVEVRSWQAISTGLFIVMILIFSALGTVDDPSISLVNGLVWFAILLSIFEVIYQTIQIKKGTDDR
ncbi:hypothetical protein [Aquisalibacillus elongatus]|uniref:Uncharacterized protein n=1 Tax=Aquisalibacillus elongatus TaxID=485577 RepID=A0A3N5BLP8_9BACI|nr:hypothetical protein [Aquisalibacillus elongatus]RPF50618.1 hypothetical protein EDC24_2586 [Aquisalibacillus elongatus]